MGWRTIPTSPQNRHLKRCLAEIRVGGFNQKGMTEIEIKSVIGSVGETIWIEP
jgi:hypothetical protein